MPEKLEVHDLAHFPKDLPPLGTSKWSLDSFKKEHEESIKDPSTFWSTKAKELLHWFIPFEEGLTGSFETGDVAWFAGGQTNVCYNAVDRHVKAGKGDQVGLIWEGDEPDDVQKLTYLEMQRRISQISNALAFSGVKRGDVVTIYMPMIPDLALTMLACARMGAVHSVVFAGFSAEALAQRISAAASKFLVTADQGKRGGKTIALKSIVDSARERMDVEQILDRVLVWERFYERNSESAPYEMKPKDIRMDELVADQRPFAPCAWQDAEDPLFLLYTSGSTGKPKGLLHTTGGYSLYAMFTCKTSFALEEGDIFACVADCGWITGHSYVVYGPLLNGSTTFMFESTPVYPGPDRYWDMVQRHKITQFYTAPTAIRLLMKYGDEPPKNYDLSSIKVLGSVGEPINPEAFRWYYEIIGHSKCTVADTYWQTETGGHIITNIPGVTPMKPGSCTLPMFGINPVVLDSQTGEEVTEVDPEHGGLTGVLALKTPWPGMARTCMGAHRRYLATYLNVYKGYYFTGDSVMKDKDGYHWIIGRVDDVLNVSGHRIGTAEVESALVSHTSVAQAAVVGQPHAIKGQSIAAFCMLCEGSVESEALVKELKALVRQDIGGFASPDLICVTPSLPMTRSGKIMRRILRKIVCDEVDSLGDTSTLADPSIVDVLIEKVSGLRK